jgi:hypothetical protein
MGAKPAVGPLLPMGAMTRLGFPVFATVIRL